MFTENFVTKEKSKFKVLFVASEAAPFAKAGGLGEVMLSLPRELRELGSDARVMIPRYASIDREKNELVMEQEGLEVPTGAEKENESATMRCNVLRYNPKNNDRRRAPITYFLENEEYFEKRSNIYGYNDDAIRWALLSRGVLEFIKHSSWRPDVIIASDWQAGFIPNYLRTAYKNDPDLNHIATIFVIHNLAYQGMFDQRFVAETDYDDGQSDLPSLFDPRLLKLNMMRRGILHADLIATVSKTYAKEIMTPEFGQMLDPLLKERRSRVYGVLNGIDYEEFNPKTDQYLAKNYDATSVERREANKLELQSRFGLTPDKKTFLLGIASRFTDQKGFDLLFPIMHALLRELKISLVVLGSGEGKYMDFFKNLEEQFPGRVGAHLNFDTVLPRLILGGADAMLIPSRFEPSGLIQLESMRYGVIPIIRKTGGLADTVEDFDVQTESGSGFVFNDFNSESSLIAIIRAYENYGNKSLWKRLQKNAMAEDFSWTHSAKEYIHLMNIALGFRRRASQS